MTFYDVLRLLVTPFTPMAREIHEAIDKHEAEHQALLDAATQPPAPPAPAPAPDPAK